MLIAKYRKAFGNGKNYGRKYLENFIQIRNDDLIIKYQDIRENQEVFLVERLERNTIALIVKISCNAIQQRMSREGAELHSKTLRVFFMSAVAQ